MHDQHGLFIDMGKDQPNPFFTAVGIQLFQRMHGCGVNGIHASHPHNNALIRILVGNVHDLVRHPKEKRAAHFIYQCVLWHLPKGKAVRIILIIYIPPAFHIRHFAHPLHKQHHCNDQSHFNSHYQIKDHRQDKGTH